MNKKVKTLAEVLCDYFCRSEEPLAVAYREHMAQPTHLEDWLDGVTVEDMLGISSRTLQHYRDVRLFPYVKIGNKIYYKRSDIEAFLEAEYGRQKVAIGREGEMARWQESQEGGVR